MSGLIKQAGAMVRVERLPVARSQPSEPAAPERDQRIDVLETRIAELERLLATERRSGEAALAAARAAGRDEVRADDAKRLAIMERGVNAALVDWRARLATIDGLAAMLAAAAVGKMFGEDADFAHRVQRTLAHHVARIGRHVIVGVRVAAADFADEAALVELAASAGLPADALTVDPALERGACRVALRLGEIELDPSAQWGVLDAALRAMAEPA